MPQGVGSGTLAFDAVAAHTAAYDAADRGGAERSHGHTEREENRPGDSTWANLTQIARQGLSDAAGQRELSGAFRSWGGRPVASLQSASVQFVTSLVPVKYHLDNRNLTKFDAYCIRRGLSLKSLACDSDLIVSWRNIVQSE